MIISAFFWLVSGLVAVSTASPLTQRELPAANSPCQQPQGNATTNPTGFLFELGDFPGNDFADPRLLTHGGECSHAKPQSSDSMLTSKPMGV